MSSRAGRTIAPRMPWVAHPDAYEAPELDPRPSEHLVSLGTPRRPQPAAQRVTEPSAVTLVTPTEPAKGAAAVVLRLGGHRLRLPVGVEIAAVRSSDGREIVYVLGVGRRVSVFTTTAAGIREMVGIDLSTLDAIRFEHFGR